MDNKSPMKILSQPFKYYSSTPRPIRQTAPELNKATRIFGQASADVVRFGQDERFEHFSKLITSAYNLVDEKLYDKALKRYDQAEQYINANNFHPIYQVAYQGLFDYARAFIDVQQKRDPLVHLTKMYARFDELDGALPYDRDAQTQLRYMMLHGLLNGILLLDPKNPAHALLTRTLMDMCIESFNKLDAVDNNPEIGFETQNTRVKALLDKANHEADLGFADTEVEFLERAYAALDGSPEQRQEWSNLGLLAFRIFKLAMDDPDRKSATGDKAKSWLSQALGGFYNAFYSLRIKPPPHDAILLGCVDQAWRNVREDAVDLAPQFAMVLKTAYARLHPRSYPFPTFSVNAWQKN